MRGLLVVGDIKRLISEAVTDVGVEHPSVPVISHMTAIINSGNLKLIEYTSSFHRRQQVVTSGYVH